MRSESADRSDGSSDWLPRGSNNEVGYPYASVRDTPLSSLIQAVPKFTEVSRSTTQQDKRYSDASDVDDLLQRILAMERLSADVNRKKRGVPTKKAGAESVHQKILAQLRMKH